MTVETAPVAVTTGFEASIAPLMQPLLAYFARRVEPPAEASDCICGHRGRVDVFARLQTSVSDYAAVGRISGKGNRSDRGVGSQPWSSGSGVA